MLQEGQCCRPDWLSCYKRQGIKPLVLTVGHSLLSNGQPLRQVASAMADEPSSTTHSMAHPRNHTSGPTTSMKGEALLALWLGLAAVAIIALIVVLGYYLSKKSTEPGTRLESMELEHGGMYVFHFNNGSFYSQGTVPTERSNLSDYLHDPEVTSQANSQTTSQMTSQMSQLASRDRCSGTSQSDTRDIQSNVGQCGVISEQYGHTCRASCNVSIRGNSPVVSTLDLCPAVNGIIPKCHNEPRTFTQGLMGPDGQDDLATYDVTPDCADDVIHEVLQSFDSNERLLNSAESSFR